MVAFLLDRGAFVDAKTISVRFDWCDYGLAHHSQKKETPLHWACMKGHVEVARILLDRGANPYIKSEVC